jgi:hypothetical protein
MVPRKYYQIQQMKTHNMKREHLRNITQRKKENLNQVIKELISNMKQLSRYKK